MVNYLSSKNLMVHKIFVIICYRILYDIISYTCIHFIKTKENNKLDDVNFFNRHEKYGFINHTKHFTEH